MAPAPTTASPRTRPPLDEDALLTIRRARARRRRRAQRVLTRA